MSASTKPVLRSSCAEGVWSSGTMPDDASRRADASAGLGAREHAALSVRADDDHGLAFAAQAFYLRRCAGDVEHGQRDVFVDVVRKLGP